MTIPTLKEFANISNEVWQIFRKYYPEDANVDDFPNDVAQIGKKYKADDLKYEYVCELLRVYTHVLNRMKGADNGKVTETT